MEKESVGCGGPTGAIFGETESKGQKQEQVLETKGAEVCPFGWEPGKSALKPGPDLVGKIWKVRKP